MDQINTQWNSKLYDQSHSFVSRFGQDVVELLAPMAGERILDLGCGTGDLAYQLIEQGAHIVGIDQSESMIREAKEKYPHIPFIVEDATAIQFYQEFDAVFSNATLHWIKEAKQVLSCIYNSLKHGGRFVAEFGGKGNVEQITKVVLQQMDQLDINFSKEKFPWYFPSVGEYTSLMEEVGFKVTFAHHFERPTPLEGINGLRNWMEMFGEAFFTEVSAEQKEQIITGMEDQLKATMFQTGEWIADYCRLRVIGIKE
ncbi:class I SAM-dependent methyltransferase [Bacillus niameyensis]|uniref:class I SAM-dependent methyltransferase n=1 Tax=Bacillus niameyensis TaxID=1522308 RepID=UPI000784F0F8|nr:class I SAM-dependent methyltransferase [Bacillus niameyensis]